MADPEVSTDVGLVPAPRTVQDAADEAAVRQINSFNDAMASHRTRRDQETPHQEAMRARAEIAEQLGADAAIVRLRSHVELSRWRLALTKWALAGGAVHTLLAEFGYDHSIARFVGGLALLSGGAGAGAWEMLRTRRGGGGLANGTDTESEPDPQAGGGMANFSESETR